jgi:glycosyltransferase involved in cell wall biosynthesis
LIGVLYDARWVGNHGIGRFAGELQKLIPNMTAFHAGRRPWHPLDCGLLGAALWRIAPKLFFSPGCNPPVGWPGSFVFSLHDLNHLCVPENSSALKRAYYDYVIRPACHRAAFVLTVSEYSRREICAWAKVSQEKVVNVGNGVGAPFVADGPKFDPGYPYLLYVGSRKPHKNLRLLLQAYRLSGVSKDVRLLLSGELDAPMAQELERLRLKECVVFKDLSADSELSKTYRGALGFLFPSLYEGFGLPPVEAMSCGAPVLTSNVCSLPEVVGDAALLVDPRDVAAVADGIRRLVEDSNLRDSLRAKGLDRSKRFSWNETAGKTLRALQLAGASV